MRKVESESQKSHKLTTTTHVCPTRTTSSWSPTSVFHGLCEVHLDRKRCVAPSRWSFYLQAVRTNNDVEGWHFHLNRGASGKSQLPFYLLLHSSSCTEKHRLLPIRLEGEIANLIERCFEANKDNFASL